VPDDRDAGQIRGQAIASLIRAGERAERTGAPARAAASYATAARLTSPDPQELPDRQPPAGALWERAAQAAVTDGSYAAAAEHASRAGDYYLQQGQARAAARAQAIAGRALRGRGRLAEAREQLIAAMEVLRAEPDHDTVYALGQLAEVEVFAASPDADRLTAEALTLSQALGASTGQSCDLLTIRGIYHLDSGRGLQAVAYLRESARLATQDGDNSRLGRALLNLSVALSPTDPAAAADAARTAAGPLRRIGARHHLAFAVGNLAQALLMLGDWDTAEAELTQAADADGLADHQPLTCYRAWLAALCGDTAATETMLAALPDLRASQAPQDQAMLGLAEGFTAAARREPQAALGHARAVLAHAGAIGISHDCLRWAWPLAARTADDLGDTAAVGELLALLDSRQPGHLAPMLRAERDLARARLAASDGDPAAAAAFAAAITSLRELSTPYHLAHGLLDHAQHLTRLNDRQAAEAALGEARAIAGRLRCQPLLDRAADLTPTPPAPAHTT
jgi:tetratricopeptide (TPR) repeat protein